MHQEEKALRELLAGIRNGEEDAVRRFVDRFGSALLRVIRRRLDPRMRRQFDSIDFLQDVMATFLTKPPEPDAFANLDALYVFLTNIARNKVIAAQRRRGRQKCDIAREHSLDGSAAYQAQGVRGSDPTPSEIAVAQEQWAGVVQGQSPSVQAVANMLREGMTYREIAAKLNIHLKTVQRVVERIRARVST